MRSKRLLAALPALAILVAACGSGDAGSESGEERLDTTAAVVTPAPAPADLEPVFVPTADGGQLDFNSLRGQDVMLWFWAPW